MSWKVTVLSIDTNSRKTVSTIVASFCCNISAYCCEVSSIPGGEGYDTMGGAEEEEEIVGGAWA